MFPQSNPRLIRQIHFSADGPVKRIAEASLRSLVSLREGEPFSPLNADFTLRQIFATEMFWDIQIRTETVDDRNEDVVIHLVRKYMVGSIRFDGSLGLDSSEIRKELAFREGEPFSEAALDETIGRLLARYRRGGYYQPNIEPRFELDVENAVVAVRLDIESGDRAQTKELQLDVEGPDLGAGFFEDLQIRPGKEFSEADLEEDLQTIRKRLALRGYFNPEIYVRDRPLYDAGSNTVRVTVRIVIRQETSVEFVGIELDEGARKALPVFSDPRPRQLRTRETADVLQERLQKDGYFLATVTVETEGASFPPSVIRFVVQQGRTYDLTRIEIDGGALPKSAKVLENLSSRTAGIVDRGKLTASTVRSDQAALLFWHQQLGYLDARVSYSFEEKDENLTLRFKVEPGLRYTVEAATLEGTASFDPADLASRLLLRSGEPFSPNAVSADQAYLESFYQNRGFRSVQVKSAVNRKDNGKVLVRFEIIEGPQFFTRDILIAGAKVTRESVIRQEIPLTQGVALSRGGILEGETNLYKLAVFSKVKVKELPSLEARTQRSLLYSVEESRRYLLSYGLGYSHSFGQEASEGLRGTLGITDGNFLGRAHTLSTNFRASSRRQRGNLSYTLPRIFDRRLPTVLSFSLDNEDRIENVEDRYFSVKGRPYDSFRIIGSAQSERVLSRKESLFYRYNFERVKNEVPPDLEEPLEFYREEENVLLSSVSVIYLNDSRIPAEDPESGFFLSGDAMLASRLIGSERQFFRFLAQGRYFYPLYPDLTLVTSLRLGVLAPFGSNPEGVTNPVPISERFFAGGATTLRGLPLDLAGPLVLDSATGQPILVGEPGNLSAVAEGGNALLVGNTELRFPLIGVFNGVIFHDIGNVFRDLKSIPRSHFTNSLGIGFFVKTPIGPIRLDVAYNPDPPNIEGFDRWNFHVNIGHPF